MNIPERYRMSSYSFNLPEQLIAQYPPKKRGESRLLVVDREKKTLCDSYFPSIVDFLPPRSLIVFNESKVFPARIHGRKPTGGRVEFLFLSPLPLLSPVGDSGYLHARVEALLRPVRGLRPGSRIIFGEDMFFVLEEKGDFGRVQGSLYWRGDLAILVKRYGEIPLPPYIRRRAQILDDSRYQTIFAREDKCGSVAAPTAGLHFSEEIFSQLRKRDISWTFITLYVGHGTFAPVRCEDIRRHQMHKEYVEISKDTVFSILRAREQGQKIVSVGTTVVRTLEGVCKKLGSLKEYRGWIDLYIYPGFDFQVVDHMITNFHLPGSSLILMVSAFAGRELILRAYSHAVEKGYRFFSYGDAMLIL